MNLTYFLTTNGILELLAIASAVAYVLLATKENVWCWPVSIISVLIYAYLCFDTNLYLETILQFFYLILSVLGWYNWNKKNQKQLQISSNSLQKNIVHILLLTIISICVAFVFKKYTTAALPFIDAPITVFSIYATFLVTNKKIENWLYWIVIDTACAYLYYNRNLQATSFLYFAYTVLAVRGYFVWKKEVANPKQ